MTTLRLPRYTPGEAPASRTIALAVSHELGLPLSTETDLYRSELVVDLPDTDVAQVTTAVHRYVAAHPAIAWDVQPRAAAGSSAPRPGPG